MEFIAFLFGVVRAQWGFMPDNVMNCIESFEIEWEVSNWDIQVETKPIFVAGYTYHSL
jgi:hypothetical protein